VPEGVGHKQRVNPGSRRGRGVWLFLVGFWLDGMIDSPTGVCILKRGTRMTKNGWVKGWIINRVKWGRWLGVHVVHSFVVGLRHV
jgi:hypothetical protein